jgi:hypothetical protein
VGAPFETTSGVLSRQSVLWYMALVWLG